MGPLMLPWTHPPLLPLIPNPSAPLPLLRTWFPLPPRLRLCSGHDPGKSRSLVTFFTQPSADISATCTAADLPPTYETAQPVSNSRPTWNNTSGTSSISWTQCTKVLSPGRTLRRCARCLGSQRWLRGGTAWNGCPRTSLAHTPLAHPSEWTDWGRQGILVHVLHPPGPLHPSFGLRDRGPSGSCGPPGRGGGSS